MPGMPRHRLPVIALMLGFALPSGCGESKDDDSSDAGADAQTDGPTPGHLCR